MNNITLTLAKIQETKNNFYFSLIERDYAINFDKQDKQWSCTCQNGSLVGVNNKQVCVHKKLAMLYLVHGISKMSRRALTKLKVEDIYKDERKD